MTQVLIVDDSLSVRKALEVLLRPFPYTVRMADSGEAALAELAQEDADLMIADVLMPGLSGFEVCERLRADPRTAALPVLLMSGLVSAQDQAQAQRVGALGLVKKPFQAEDILPLVHAALRPTAPSLQGLPSGNPWEQLLQALLNKPGVLSAAVVDDTGQMVASQGDVPADAAVLAQYYRFFATAAEVLGTRRQDTWQGSLLEFGQFALLLSPLEAQHLLATTVRDVSSANVVKYLLKTQGVQPPQTA